MDRLTPQIERMLPATTIVDDTVIVPPLAMLEADATEIGAPIAGELAVGPGTRIGEYELVAPIDQGGMGVVYEAFHPLIGKRAAIKILKKELCTDPAQLERFSDEARVVNHIGHPNIVDIFAFGDMPDGRRYLVMEWLDGESLRQRIERAPVSIAEVATIIKPLARALQAAHAKDVIHRDLKPDNVFLARRSDDEGTIVKLLDFGIAKLVRNDRRIEKTATGAMVGTPQYIAPEQAKGYAVDPRADIYALGGILFELLTGRAPFVADNAMEVVAKHIMEPAVAPSSIASDIPPALDAITLRMLAKQPEERPTLVEVIEAFGRAPSSSPFETFTPMFAVPAIPATPSPDALPAYPVVRRATTVAEPSKRALMLAVIILGMLSTVLLVYLLAGGHASTAPEPVPVPTSRPGR